MKKEVLRPAVAALAFAWVFIGCQDGADGGPVSGSDSDTDADTDSDADSDTDSGSDADTGEPCGEFEEPCCEDGPACVEDATPVTYSEGYGNVYCDCYQSCSPPLCEDELEAWAADSVPCGDVSSGGGIGACFAEEDLDPVVEGCWDSSEPCTTWSGYEDGICLSDGTNLYCLRLCVPDDDVCDVLGCAVAIDESGDLIPGVCI